MSQETITPELEIIAFNDFLLRAYMDGNKAMWDKHLDWLPPDLVKSIKERRIVSDITPPRVLAADFTETLTGVLDQRKRLVAMHSIDPEPKAGRTFLKGSLEIKDDQFHQSGWKRQIFVSEQGLAEEPKGYQNIERIDRVNRARRQAIEDIIFKKSSTGRRITEDMVAQARRDYLDISLKPIESWMISSNYYQGQANRNLGVGVKIIRYLDGSQVYPLYAYSGEVVADLQNPLFRENTTQPCSELGVKCPAMVKTQIIKSQPFYKWIDLLLNSLPAKSAKIQSRK